MLLFLLEKRILGFYIEIVLSTVLDLQFYQLSLIMVGRFILQTDKNKNIQKRYTNK